MKPALSSQKMQVDNEDKSGRKPAGRGPTPDTMMPKINKQTPRLGQVRRLVLSCAEHNSFMEQEFRKQGWEVIVISEEDDVTSEYGLTKAISA